MRVAIIYLFVIIGVRVIGKRELSEISPFELIMLMLIPEIASQALNREDHSLTNAIIGISTLLCLVFFNSILTYLSPTFRNFVDGKPVVMFYQGKFIQDVLDREGIDASEILEEARGAGFESLDAIKWVILEPGGKMSCIPYENNDDKVIKKTGRHQSLS